jgi:hypothetical protein
MKKDIEIRKVTDIGFAIVPPAKDALDSPLWDVYLINQKNYPLKNVLINSRGFGKRQEENLETSTFRFFYEEIPAQCAIKVENIQSELFDLAQEYFLSFSADGYLFDKRFIFVSGSIMAENFTLVPFVNEEGVLII